MQRIRSSSALGFRQRRSMALEAELLLGVPGSFISDRHIVTYAVQNPLWNVKSLQDLLFDASVHIDTFARLLSPLALVLCLSMVVPKVRRLRKWFCAALLPLGRFVSKLTTS